MRARRQVARTHSIFQSYFPPPYHSSHTQPPRSFPPYSSCPSTTLHSAIDGACTHFITDKIFRPQLFRYPVLIGSREGRPAPTPLHTCPAAGQRLLVVLRGLVDVRLFAPSQRPHLQPQPGMGPWLHDFTYAADVWRGSEHDLADFSEAGDGNGSGSSGNGSVAQPGPLKPRGFKRPNPLRSPRPLPGLNMTYGRLSAGDMLYVPQQYLLSWRESAFSGGGARLLSFCYHDASSLNDAKETLALESHVSPSSHAVLEAINGPELDTAMAREASDMPYSRFVTWPRPTGAADEEMDKVR